MTKKTTLNTGNIDRLNTYFLRYEGKIPHHPTVRRSTISMSVGDGSIWMYWSASKPGRPWVRIQWFPGNLINMPSLWGVVVSPYYYKQAMEQIINIVLLQVEVPLDWKPDLKPSNHQK
jgi:hypothetical protein